MLCCNSEIRIQTRPYNTDPSKISRPRRRRGREGDFKKRCEESSFVPADPSSPFRAHRSRPPLARAPAAAARYCGGLHRRRIPSSNRTNVTRDVIYSLARRLAISQQSKTPRFGRREGRGHEILLFGKICYTIITRARARVIESTDAAPVRIIYFAAAAAAVFRKRRDIIIIYDGG